MGRLLDEADYEVGLNDLVARFEIKCAELQTLGKRAGPELSRVLELARSSTKPLTYREIMAKLKLPETRANRWKAASWLTCLTARGYLRRVESTVRSHRKPNRAINAYTFDLFGRSHRLEEAAARFLKAVEHLNCRRARNDELKVRIVNDRPGTEPFRDRNRLLVAARVRGQSLAAIGREYGLSRERVRQIVLLATGREKPTQTWKVGSLSRSVDAPREEPQ